MPTKQKDGFKKYTDLIKQLENLNKRMTKDPLLFYGEVGREAILLSKEVHILGSQLLRQFQLKRIPIRITVVS